MWHFVKASAAEQNIHAADREHKMTSYAANRASADLRQQKTDCFAVGFLSVGFGGCLGFLFRHILVVCAVEVRHAVGTKLYYSVRNGIDYLVVMA